MKSQGKLEFKMITLGGERIRAPAAHQNRRIFVQPPTGGRAERSGFGLPGGIFKIEAPKISQQAEMRGSAGTVRKSNTDLGVPFGFSCIRRFAILWRRRNSSKSL